MPLSALSPTVRVLLSHEEGGRTTPCNISALVRSRLDCLDCALDSALGAGCQGPKRLPAGLHNAGADHYCGTAAGLYTIRRRKSARDLLQKALYTVGLASSPLPRLPSQTQTLSQTEGDSTHPATPLSVLALPSRALQSFNVVLLCSVPAQCIHCCKTQGHVSQLACQWAC